MHGMKMSERQPKPVACSIADHSGRAASQPANALAVDSEWTTPAKTVLEPCHTL